MLAGCRNAHPVRNDRVAFRPEIVIQKYPSGLYLESVAFLEDNA